MNIPATSAPQIQALRLTIVRASYQVFVTLYVCTCVLLILLLLLLLLLPGLLLLFYSPRLDGTPACYLCQKI